MTPDQIETLKRAVDALDEEYWNGSHTSVTAAFNVVEDLVAEIRAVWPSGD
jgi:hypothetical protein